MKNKKLNFDELFELYKKDINAYRKYLDNCSWDELMNYTSEGLNDCKKSICELNRGLEKTLNKIDLSKFYKKYNDLSENHEN
jgi:hypothetical protein